MRFISSFLFPKSSTRLLQQQHHGGRRPVPHLRGPAADVHPALAQRPRLDGWLGVGGRAESAVPAAGGGEQGAAVPDAPEDAGPLPQVQRPLHRRGQGLHGAGVGERQGQEHHAADAGETGLTAVSFYLCWKIRRPSSHGSSWATLNGWPRTRVRDTKTCPTGFRYCYP